MNNYWLSNIEYSINTTLRAYETVHKSKNKNMDISKMKMATAERELADALLNIAKKYGKLADYDGNGIWVGYVPRSENDNYEIGVRCENCVLHESANVCRVVKRRIEPGGYCRLAAIPDGIVNSEGNDDEEEEEDEEDDE